MAFYSRPFYRFHAVGECYSEYLNFAQSKGELPDFVFGFDTFSAKMLNNARDSFGIPTGLDINEHPHLHVRPSYRDIKPREFLNLSQEIATSIQNTSVLTTTSPGFERYLENYCPSEMTDKSCHVVYNTNYDLPVTPVLRSKLGFSPNDFVVVSGATIRQNYGFENLLTALNSLPRAIKLLHVGPFADEKSEIAIRTQIKKRGLESRVSFIGPIYGEDYTNHLACGDVAVIPFPSDDPQFKDIAPGRLFDFLSAGLPVVATTNDAFHLLNSKFEFGSQIPTNTVPNLREGILHYYEMSDAQIRIKRENSAKAIAFARSSGSLRSLTSLMQKSVGKFPVAHFVCGSAIGNNLRAIKFINALAAVADKVEVLAVIPPREDIRDTPDHVNFHRFTFRQDENLNTFAYLRKKVSPIFEQIEPHTPIEGEVQQFTFNDVSFNGKEYTSPAIFGAGQEWLTKKFEAFVFDEACKFQPDLVISHDMLCGSAISRLMDEFDAPHVIDVTEIPVMSQRAGANFRSLPKSYMDNFDSLQVMLGQAAKKIVTLSEGFGDLMRDMYDRDIGVIVNSRGRFEGKADFTIRRSLGIADDDIAMITTSTFSPISYAVETVEALAETSEKHHLVFMGLGTSKLFEACVLEAAKDHGVQDRVHIYPPIYDEDMYLASLKSFDFGLCLLNTEFDQVRLLGPNRYFDMIAAELPILSTAMQDCLVISQRFKNGIIIDAEDIGDTMALPDAMEVMFQTFGSAKRRKRKAALTKAALNFSDSEQLETFAQDCVDLIPAKKNKNSPRILYLARQRMHINNRIIRQIAALEAKGAIVNLVCVVEGPPPALRTLLNSTTISIMRN